MRGCRRAQPKPRSFADPAWRASVTDDHIRKVIVGGGTAVGKSALMTANPDLADNKAVLDGLVKIVRGLRIKVPGLHHRR